MLRSRKKHSGRSDAIAEDRKKNKIAGERTISTKIRFVEVGVALLVVLLFFFGVTELLQDESEEMYFVLHISPEEVGTISLQEAFGTDKLKNLLALDNYMYIGRYLKYDLGNRAEIDESSAKEEPKAFSSFFLRHVENLRDDGMHLMASNEYVEAMHPHHVHGWKSLFDILASGPGPGQSQQTKRSRKGSEPPPRKRQNWNLVVAISYRRLHDWEPAHWNYLYSKKREPITRKVLRNEHTNWPGVDGDYAIPGFREHFDREYQSSDIMAPKHPAKLAYESWKDVADEIVLINLNDHDEASYSNVEKVLCHALPGPRAACSSIRNDIRAVAPEPKRTTLHKMKPNECLNCDILGVHAHETKILDETVGNRQWVVKKILEVLNRWKGNSLPMDCLSQSALDAFRKWSLDGDEWFAATTNMQKRNGNARGERITAEGTSFLTPEQQSDFASAWDQSVADQRFCSVDMAKTVEIEYWHQSLANLNGMYKIAILAEG